MDEQLKTSVQQQQREWVSRLKRAIEAWSEDNGYRTLQAFYEDLERLFGITKGTFEQVFYGKGVAQADPNIYAILFSLGIPEADPRQIPPRVYFQAKPAPGTYGTHERAWSPADWRAWKLGSEAKTVQRFAQEKGIAIPTKGTKPSSLREIPSANLPPSPPPQQQHIPSEPPAHQTTFGLMFDLLVRQFGNDVGKHFYELLRPTLEAIQQEQRALRELLEQVAEGKGTANIITPGDIGQQIIALHNALQEYVAADSSEKRDQLTGEFGRQMARLEIILNTLNLEPTERERAIAMRRRHQS